MSENAMRFIPLIILKYCDSIAASAHGKGRGHTFLTNVQKYYLKVALR